MRKAAATLVAACSFAVLSSPLSHGEAVDATGSIAHARRLIEANDHAAAVGVLEDALIEAEAKDRTAIIQLLRQSYAELAKRAEGEGRQREAAHYRDNLAILNRDLEPSARPKDADEKPKPPVATKSPATPEPSAGQPAAAAVPAPVPSKKNDESRVQPDSAHTEKTASNQNQNAASTPPADTEIALTPPRSPQSPANESPPPEPRDANPGASTGPVHGAEAPHADSQPAPARASVAEADRLYRAKNYLEAGKCYAELARESRLPAERKEHWAYCRYVSLVDWINKGPRSQREWNQIHEELESIQRLAPKVWYGEYFRDKMAELRRKGSRGLPQPDDLVIRGSAPDDKEPKRFPRILDKLKGRTSPQPEGAPRASRPVERPLELPIAASGLPPVTVAAAPSGAGAGAAPADNEAANQPLEPLDVEDNHASPEPTPEATSTWQIHETPNFRIFHRNAGLADSAGQTAEAVRAAQGKQWGSHAAAKRWTPACEIYLYPDGKALKAATQQPESSPGFSTMTSDGAQIVARRVNLRADHPQLLAAILPHEVTHVVLADIFCVRQIPRWADEGLAVLAEPHSEQKLRWAELEEPLQTGRIFALEKLMGMDYPEPKDWSLYYAQSVSLTRFLVDQNTPERFIQFVLDSHQKGIEPALQECYQIKGFTELQDRWKAYAKQQVATLTASARESSDRSPPAASRSGGPVEGAQERQPREGQR
jgi:hypothetical protein